MFLLLLLHVRKRCGDRCLEIFVLLFHLLCGRRSSVGCQGAGRSWGWIEGVLLNVLQAHGQGLLKILIENIINSSISRLHRRGASVLVRICWRSIQLLMPLPSKFSIAAVVNANWSMYAEVKERHRLAGTLLVKAVAAVSAVVLPVRKGKRRSTSHTNIGIGPFGRSTAVNHAAGNGLSWRELVSLSLKIPVHFANVG